MAQIRKGGKKKVPAISTASLPDVVFMLLFFFMAATSMKEVTYMVTMRMPEATELQKLEKNRWFATFTLVPRNRNFKNVSAPALASNLMMPLQTSANWKTM